MKERIGIIFGGRSSEYEISLMSTASVIRAIDKNKYQLVFIGITKNGDWKIVKGIEQNLTDLEIADIIENGDWTSYARDFSVNRLKDYIDFALPIVHGPNCEDGKLQGLFETLNIPYGGCGVLASAVAMDKEIAKKVFEANGLPICKSSFITKSEYQIDSEKKLAEIEKAIGYPAFVKPANLGSSVGISKAEDRASLIKAIDLALRYDKRVVIEEFINARELETGILGNEIVEACEVGEILPSAEFYDYNAKYFDGGESKLCIPADIPAELREEIRLLAIKAYKAIDGEGFSRVDFFLDRDTKKLYLNEINTIPGFTKFSMFPLLWEAVGVEYKETIERIIRLGYERHNTKNSRKTTL